MKEVRPARIWDKRQFHMIYKPIPLPAPLRFTEGDAITISRTLVAVYRLTGHKREVHLPDETSVTYWEYAYIGDTYR